MKDPNQYDLSEFKGPLPCPSCASTKFIGEQFMELWIHPLNRNVQIQKHQSEIHCRVCGIQVNTKGERVGF
jgi:hypothetical protein